MQAQRVRNTQPEVALRKVLHAAGLRYGLHRRIPGTRREIDIALVRYRTAVFVDGCFWHGCPEHGTVPRTNQEWWTEKLHATARRDRDTDERLVAHGWRVIRIWEHEDPVAAAARVVDLLRKV